MSRKRETPRAHASTSKSRGGSLQPKSLGPVPKMSTQQHTCNVIANAAMLCNGNFGVLVRRRGALCTRPDSTPASANALMQSIWVVPTRCWGDPTALTRPDRKTRLPMLRGARSAFNSTILRPARLSDGWQHR